jgi:hypothetical protein
VVIRWTFFWNSTEYVDLGAVLPHGDLLEGRPQLQRRVGEDGVREGDPRAARVGPVGHHDPRTTLLGESVQAVGRVRPIASAERAQQLVARGAARAGGEEAERDVERQRSEASDK